MTPDPGSPDHRPAPTPWQLFGMSWRALGSCLSCLVALLGLLFFASALFMMIDGCGH